jgi:hypothetical protein
VTISFMVLGGPRSATTWMANLLTTDQTLCLHDPLLEHTMEHLERMRVPGKRIGISDSAALLWSRTQWFIMHPSKKIVLWREPEEINASIRQLGLREIEGDKHKARVDDLKNVPVYPWKSVFKASVAYEICRYFEVPFCPYRFEELKKMNIQPQFSQIPVAREAAQELVRRLAEELK